MRTSGNASADAARNAAHTGMKSVTLTAAELSDDVQIHCTLAGTSPTYGTVSVDDTFLVRHTRGEADGQIWYTQAGNSRRECMETAQENLLWLMSLLN